MKNIWKIDLAVILISVFVLIVLVGYARPLVIAPMDEYETQENNILFSFERANILFIDDNDNFTTPDEYFVKDGLELILEPGVYYWKVKGIEVSEVRKLTINSKVELKLIETKDGFGVVNAGNVGLNVDVYDEDELVDKIKLEVGDVGEGGDKFVGAVE